MRISTSMIFSNATSNMQKLQSGIYRLQNQMSTERRILTPSDDPVAAAQALAISQNQAVNQQYLDNQNNAADQLAFLEGHVSSIRDLIIEVQTQAASVANGSGNDTSRKAVATDIRQRYEELMGLANGSNAMGDYIFAGYSSKTQPFSATGAVGSRTVTYSGDTGTQQLQVSSGRLMDVTENGAELFMNIPQGNGQFVASAGTGNTGTGVLSSSAAIGGYDGNTYALTYDAATTSFAVSINGVASGSVSYTAGSTIALPPAPATARLNVAISGAPANGDTFTVAPSANQDIFETLDNMIAALESNVSASDANMAAFKNQMSVITGNLNQALDHVLAIQTGIGARRNEVDSLVSAATDLDTQYQANLDRLQKLDMVKAVSDMANQKMVLDAAQLSFKQVSQLSLFNYL